MTSGGCVAALPPTLSEVLLQRLRLARGTTKHKVDWHMAKLKRETNIDDFKEFHGLPHVALAKIWENLQTSEIVLDQARRGNFRPDSSNYTI